MPPTIRRTGPHDLLDLSVEFPILNERLHRALSVPPPARTEYGPYRTPAESPGARNAIIEEALAILVQREPSLDVRPGSVVRTLVETSVASLTPQELSFAVDRAREEYAEQVAEDLTVHGTYADPATTTMPEFRPSMLREMIETVERLRPYRSHDDRVDAFRYALTSPPRPSTGLNPCGEIPLVADPPWMMQEQLGSCVVNATAYSRVRVPEFEIHSNPTVRIDDIRNRRFTGSGRPPRKDPPLIEALLRHREKQYKRPSTVVEGPLTGSTAPTQMVQRIERRSIWQRILEEGDE